MSGPGRLMVELRYLLASGDRERAGEHNVKQLRAESSGQTHCFAGETDRKGALPPNCELPVTYSGLCVQG